jgi:hypothetical protein
MDVEVGSWQGDPQTLEQVLTPVRISIENEGDHTVSLRYQNFTLSNPAGARSTALPPFNIRGTVNTNDAPISPAFRYRGFMAYPGYRFYGPSFGYWTDNWGWDDRWYANSYGFWQRELPTADMLRQAIPEGVLNAGGELDGYLYFQKIPDNATAVQLEVVLMDARDHRQFGVLRIPFDREKN